MNNKIVKVVYVAELVGRARRKFNRNVFKFVARVSVPAYCQEGSNLPIDIMLNDTVAGVKFKRWNKNIQKRENLDFAALLRRKSIVIEAYWKG